LCFFGGGVYCWGTVSKIYVGVLRDYFISEASPVEVDVGIEF